MKTIIYNCVHIKVNIKRFKVFIGFRLALYVPSFMLMKDWSCGERGWVLLSIGHLPFRA